MTYKDVMYALTVKAVTLKQKYQYLRPGYIKVRKNSHPN